MKFANLLGRVNSVIILTFLFIVVFGLYAIIRRAINFLFRGKLSGASPNTFWISKKYDSPELDILERQF